MSGDKKIIFSMVKVSKQTPQGKQIIKDIHLSFYYGAKIGILGLNGAGKSSVMKIIAGIDKSFQGEVVFSPGYKVGYLAQEPILDEKKTVLEIVQEGVQETVNLLKKYDDINNQFIDEEVINNPDKMNELIELQGRVQEQIDQIDAWDLDSKLELAMDALRTPDGSTYIKNLSGGERRRVALCRLLLQQPDILLLDEPTNHLDAESVHWLEQYLQNYKGTVIAVTHDRYFLDNVAGWILELDRGKGIPFKGNYSSWLEQKSKRLSQEEKIESKRKKALDRELEWVRKGQKGRQSKGKARLNNYNNLMNQSIKEKELKIEIPIPNGPRLGKEVIQAINVAKSYDDKLLYENLNFSLPPAGIVGIIGPNGAGKTTLFKMIMNEEKPDLGEFKIGQTVKIGYVDQRHKTINETNLFGKLLVEEMK